MKPAFQIDLRDYDLSVQKKAVFLAFAVSDGSNLIARGGARLDDRLKYQCLRRNINVISVVYRENEYDILDSEKKQVVAVPKTVSSLGHEKIEHFNKFAASFTSGTEKLTEQFDVIKQTGKVDELAVYRLFQDMVDIAPLKSDLLKYSHFLKTHDDHTFAHSQKVAILCNMLGTWMDLPKSEIEMVTLAGLLHDIGKTELDVRLLKKKDKLTNIEYEQLKKHTKLGSDFIISDSYNDRLARLVLDHHERVDGSGYSGKKAKELDKHVNILMLCDVYAALTSDRPYKKAMCPFFAIKYLTLSERSKLDAEVTHYFLLHIAQQYVGSKVRLTDNTEWEIVFINSADITRPLLRNDAGEFLSLMDNRSLDILTLV